MKALERGSASDIRNDDERSTALQGRGRRVSIIIVNWNSLVYLQECLQSIYENTRDIEFEVIVIDNASTVDETVAIKAVFPLVITIRSDKNLGFAGANNLGFQYASAPNILFLNPDTKVLGSAVVAMLSRLECSPEVGALGCKLLNTDGSVQTSCIQRFPTITNQVLDLEFLRQRWPLWNIWGIAPLFNDSEELSDVEVISGACLMVTRDAFERAGSFSAKYFMYAEDVDLCYQVRKAGWRVCYTGHATVIHHGGGTSRRRKGSEWIAIMQREAILKFCRMAHGRLYAVGYRAATGLNAICRLFLLAVLFPFRREAEEKGMVYSTSDKWMSVLKWAVGLEHSTSKRTANA
jgi:GT2 family glycosyltransferase